MGIAYTTPGNSKNCKTLIPLTDFPEQLVLEAVRDRQVLHHPANKAVGTMLDQVPHLFIKYKLVRQDYERPGQTMSGLKKRLDRMVEDNYYWFDEAVKLGLAPTNPRPKTGYVPAPFIPPVGVVMPTGPSTPSSTITRVKGTAKAPAIKMPVSVPNLEVPTDDYSTCTVDGQLRRADGVWITNKLIAQDLIKREFMEADFDKGDKFNGITQEQLDLIAKCREELGMTADLLPKPEDFPVLLNGEVIRKAGGASAASTQTVQIEESDEEDLTDPTNEEEEEEEEPKHDEE